ncbi:MAG: hypothetical protein GYB66_09645 [Chloroflexi bacterium]|nr:hypothetical protein [Chloroflexota bacterium]
MDKQYLNERFAAPVNRWRDWLERHGLSSIAGSMLEAASPLSVFGAQIIYILQPALGLVWKHDTIRDWAQLLETPEGLGWLREMLTETPASATEDNYGK